MGKQKMRVREVVPVDFNKSVVIPKDNIRVKKSIYDDLHYREKQER